MTPQKPVVAVTKTLYASAILAKRNQAILLKLAVLVVSDHRDAWLEVSQPG
jgi:hypothetical protein